MTFRLLLAAGILTTVFLAGCDEATPVPIDGATPSASMTPAQPHMIKGDKL